MYRLFFIALFWMWYTGMLAQRKLIVASLESKAPQRDIKVRVDNGNEFLTPWSGEIEVPDSFKRITLSHPKFQHRYVLRNELHNDTIYLIPALHAVDEVVVLGTDRSKSMMANILRPTTPKEPPLPQVVAAGPNVLAMLAWLYSVTVGPKLEARQKRKQALKIVHQKEQEYEARWDALMTPQAKQNTETKP